MPRSVIYPERCAQIFKILKSRHGLGTSIDVGIGVDEFWRQVVGGDVQCAVELLCNIQCRDVRTQIKFHELSCAGEYMNGCPAHRTIRGLDHVLDASTKAGAFLESAGPLVTLLNLVTHTVARRDPEGPPAYPSGHRCCLTLVCTEKKPSGRAPDMSLAASVANLPNPWPI